MRFLKQFINVLGFMTILPFGSDDRMEPKDFGRLPAMFPLVGLVIGLFLFLFRFTLEAFDPPASIIPILVTTFLVILTRGFHLDGLADTMDGLLSHRSQEEKLAIMKDPHQGTFGVLAIILDILLKVALLGALFNHPGQAFVLFLFPAWGRLSTTVVTTFCNYARPSGGLGQWMVEYAGPGTLFFASSVTIVISALFGLHTFICSIFALLVGFILVIVWNLTLKGVTGDLLGATTELSELATLLFFLLLS
ncbi:MAG: adenosylcobinamide-GDP ribazoletransferase [Deltaproteobacteria bacterium]|jgi:adenosylcobinamide-GDP ribazoletransferase|nr:adenosylcobinamide-GDP ribazoletransferase [Deltaproteobacteria bacterium]